MGGIEPQYVCVHVPEFPAQARLRVRPEQAREPVVILEGEPPLQEVCSTTRKARQLGAANGMTRAQVEAISGLVLLQRSFVEERATRSAMLGIAAVFTPRVQVVETPTSQTCVFDMTGSELLFGGVQDSIRSIACAVRSLGLRSRFAASSNFHAAVCAAPYAVRGPCILTRNREHEHLGRLPVVALPLTEEQTETFALWGIRTLAELAALPETDLITRLGQEGKRLRSMARGEWPHLMVPEEAAFTLEEFAEFDAPEDRLEALLFVAGPMLDQLIARAQMHALSLVSVTITLPLDGGGEHIRMLKTALPLADRAVLLKLMNLDLQAHPPSAAVMGLRLSAEPGKRGKVQMGLFSPQLPEPTRLDVTLAQIEAMVGEGRVGSPRLSDTHRPDSFTMERFVPPAKPSSASRPQLSTVLRHVRPPLGLRVWLDAPTGKPKSFFFESKRYIVTEAYGPWRQSGEWWSEHVWSREEWDVRATCGEFALLCVLAHDLLHEFWLLEAFYD